MQVLNPSLRLIAVIGYLPIIRAILAQYDKEN